MSHHPPTLVIGYGNELRGDDAAGPLAARALAALNRPGTRVLVVHQLTPELAEAIAQARAVFFLDASIEVVGSASLTPLAPDPSSALRPHQSQPAGLLALARELYGAAPPAWMIRIPARCFDLGAPLSETASRGAARAVALIQQHLQPGAAPAPASRATTL